MTPIQKIIYDSLRSLGLAYLSTDRDGAVNMVNRTTQHALCIYPSGQLYEVRAGKYLNVTFR